MGNGKVILVRVGDHMPKLIPVTALQIERQSNTVILAQEISLDGQEPVNVVPLERCFEFDADLMSQVNALTEGAILQLSAAQQLCNAGLLQAEFSTDGEESPLITH